MNLRFNRLRQGHFDLTSNSQFHGIKGRAEKKRDSYVAGGVALWGLGLNKKTCFEYDSD